MKYVISYDLTAPRQDYESLWAELRRLGAKPVLKSQWCVRRSNTTAASLRDHIGRFMDSDDRLLVTCLDNKSWASRRLINKISDM
ncbi:MAG: hypothetical protein OXR82_17575 [Gammaproteobacteria bacterium]|nr:hypothetical protein [Gammaproteobacteria bacterium]